MAALLMPLDDWFAMLSPISPAWVLPLVFTGMTVSVSVMIESRARPAGAAEAALPQVVMSVAADPDTLAGADLHRELRAVLGDVQQEADRLDVQLELAVPPGLLVRPSPDLLRQVLRGLLCHAVAHASHGRVFVGGMRADDCVRLIIIDDGKTPAGPVGAELRRPLARLLAESGAGLLVDNRPGDGTTLVLSLPEAG